MPKTSRSAHQRDLVIKLRVEDRLGLKEICRRTGAAKSTVRDWLNEVPDLTMQEKAELRSKRPPAPPKKELHPLEAGKKAVSLGLPPGVSGRVGELEVHKAILELGLHATKGDEGDPVDLYVRRKDSLATACLQVRCTTPLRDGTGLPTISLRRSRGGVRYDPLIGGRHFHFIVGFCRENSRNYVFHWKEVGKRRNCITVTDDACDAWWKIERWLEGDESWLPPKKAKRKAAAGSRAKPGQASGRRLQASRVQGFTETAAAA